MVRAECGGRVVGGAGAVVRWCCALCGLVDVAMLCSVLFVLVKQRGRVRRRRVGPAVSIEDQVLDGK